MKSRICFFFLVTALSCSSILAQAPVRPAADTLRQPRTMPPNVQPNMAPKPANGPRPYAEVITGKGKTSNGLFKIHKQDDRFFFEIPNSLLNRDILVVNRISKAAAESRVQTMGYAGDQIGENVVRFEKGPNNKLFLRSISYKEVSKDSSESGMYHSVLNSNVQPIVATFDVKAYSKENTGTVVDVTDFVGSDNDVLFFDAGVKKSLSLGMQINDRSYIDDVKAFASNIEVRVVKTYYRQSSSGGTSSQAASGPATYELNSSMLLLPKTPMKPRYFDPRVGYFATGYTDFDANPQGVKKLAMITRWRLEPKPEDIEKYKRGELVEPKKPITFYIDPATPKKWVPYLIQGVNDWNVAFEKAGWKNAIVAKEAPEDDSTWSIDDASHSAIVYKPSDVPNASGPHVHDPRSGEILETHVNWYHNVMSLVHNWYFVQAAAVDPMARKMQFDDKLMGQLIRFVSSHEVGHTLGLRHNFGSSSTVPVEKLRDKAWVEANGHTPSIMDYARFNYVAQPEDSISQAGLFPRIGEYDKWAIEWGYRWFPDARTPEQEKPILNQWIVAELGKNKQLFFGTEMDINDPREQNEDLGDNAMKAGAYGIKNLKRILPNLVEWTTAPNEGYENARKMHTEVVSQFNRYLGHVTKNIGGITTTYKVIEQEGPGTEFVPRAIQKEAMQFLQQQLFTTPVWLMDKKMSAIIGYGEKDMITPLQSNVLNKLLSGATMDKLISFETYEPSKAYTATEMLNDLKKGIFSELTSGSSINIYRRNLQKLYVEKLTSLLDPAPASSSSNQQASAELNKLNDAASIVKGHIRMLTADIQKALPAVKDNSTRWHLQDVRDRLIESLDPKH